MRSRVGTSPENPASRGASQGGTPPIPGRWASDALAGSRPLIFERSTVDPVREDLQRDLHAIEASLTRACSEHELRTEAAARMLLASGGKRVRALLTCAVCRAVGGDPSPHVDLAAAVELAHSGSLLHDDILDGAETRRGRQCAHLVFDVSTAILAGDFLLILALERVASSSSSSLRSCFSSALKKLCTGEALERERRFDATVALAHSRRVNRLKTASLFEYAAEAGAILGGGDSEDRSAARSYGIAVGEAFQLTDDLLDVQGNPATVGKSVGMDLKAGLVTVPVAIALELEPALRSSVRRIWQLGEKAGRSVAQLCDRMDRIGAFASTRELVIECTDRACAAVESLPAGPWRDQLSAFACAIARRQQ